MLAILDGTVSDASQAQIPATDDGFLRGDGVFEVMRLYGGRPFALDDHLTRLGRSAANLRLPIDVEAVRADVEALIERNEVAGRRAARGRHARRAAPGDRRGAQAAARDARAGHDRVRPDARARPGQVALLRRQHARPPPGPGAGRRRRAARHAARPRAGGPDVVVRVLAGRRDARHAAAVRAHPRLDHAPAPARRDRGRPSRSSPATTSRACARRSWPRRCARCTRCARSTAPS